jgi:diketogulonate reductase-like aldo/keto reductase
MNLKELGRTGVMLPEIGIGTWAYTGGRDTLRKGFELGMPFIDTAEIYGTEAIVGEAIAGLRDRVFVATKVAADHFERKEVHRAADRSLALLKTDRIDLYQLHWPNPAVPVEETIGAMEELVDAGKVRFIGVSNFDTPLLKRSLAAARKYPIVSNQLSYSLIDRNIETELLPFCESRGLTVIAYSPLGRRFQDIFDRDPERALSRVASTVGRTEAQVALNWSVSRPNVVAIVKTDSPARMAENCAASGWRLTPEQMALLDRIRFDRKNAAALHARRAVGRILRVLRLRA